MLDPIAEMLTKIRNAQGAGKSHVNIGASKIKKALAKILQKEGFIESVTEEKVDGFDSVKLGLKYYVISKTKKIPAIKGIRRVSKEGQRIYVKHSDIRKVKNGYGIGIVSTSKGVMTDYESKQSGLGGEYICEVW